MFFNAILAFITGYLIGSIPTAYLAVKCFDRRDIRCEGSGNIGALNTYEVTGKKWLGIIVGVVDFLKGILAVLIMMLIGQGYAVSAVAGVGAITGHNKNIWIRFRGGRGLATALGVMIFLGWIFPLIWCLVWFVTFKIKPDIHTGNIIATVSAPVVMAFLPSSWVIFSSWNRAEPWQVVFLSFVVAFLILSKHADSISSMIRQRN